MAIRPDWLDGVAADSVDPEQPERRGGEGAFGAFVQLAEGIDFALAAGAGTVAAQGFEPDVILVAVVPADGQLLADRFEM